MPENEEKFYAKDISVFSLEGKSGVVGVFVSVLFAPVRVVCKVMSSIMFLPADLLKRYTKCLLISSIVMFAIGVIDFAIYGKWALCISQIPVFLVSFRFWKKSSIAIENSEKVAEVQIDLQEIQNLCNSIYDELDSITQGVKK